MEPKKKLLSKSDKVKIGFLLHSSNSLGPKAVAIFVEANNLRDISDEEKKQFKDELMANFDALQAPHSRAPRAVKIRETVVELQTSIDVVAHPREEVVKVDAAVGMTQQATIDVAVGMTQA